MKRSRSTSACSDQAATALVDASEKSGGNTNLLPETPAAPSIRSSASAPPHHASKPRNDDDDDASSNNNNSNKNDKVEPPVTLLTPHTHRLLKLILEGTAEHAAEASVHLLTTTTTTIASQQYYYSSAATQLWEIMGRLQEGLTSNTWKTRSQAADALQGIARQLPLSDQLEFLQMGKKEETTTTSLVPKGETTISSSRQESRHHYLTIHDLSVGGLDKVLAEGRLLMATSNDRYDVVKERELRDLDRSVLQDRMDDTGSKVDFVERRMKLQRHILAQRLGLAGIGDVLGEQNVLPQAITSEDMADRMNDDEPLAEAKRLRHAKRVKQQENLTQKKTIASDNKLKDDSLSVRALLVMEMEEQQRKGGGGGSATSHRNPQELLANELVYRMFDPAWHVRHGALLGTLSLLRAWKTYANQNDDLFGRWPQDVLARCLCVLALDRFGDFSGALATATTSNVTGSVIAPVREVSGQLISVLFVMAPEAKQLATLDLLFRLCEYSSEWEPRHGALVALKYVLVVLKTMRMSKKGGCDNDCIKKMMDQIAQISIRCLSDTSDDVRGTAAQVITEYLHSCNSIEPFLLKSSPSILQSVKTARSFSSCMVDLVQLLAEMLRIDARAFVTALSVSKDFVSNIKDISEVILGLLDSDFESVQSSALRSITAFCKLLCSGSVLDENGTHDNFYSEAARICRRFAEKIFEWYFVWCEDVEPRNDEVTTLLTLRDEVWDDLMLVVQSLYLRSEDEMRKLESNLLQRYFWIEDLLRSPSEDTPIYSQASSALASFLIASGCTLSISSQVSLSCMLDSPWVYHCEASCLLFSSLCAQKVTVSGSENVRLTLASLLQESPLCLIVRDEPNFAGITRDKTFFDLCEQIFWAELSDSVASTKTTPPINSVSKKISAIWMTALESRGMTRSESSTKSTSFCGMRVEACIGSAIVVSGLPARVTPVVRSLMTSLKNESNPSRQALTCTSLVLLVKKLGHKPAQKKILDKICSIANGEDCSDSSSEAVQDIAGRVLCSVTRSIPSGEELKAIQPFWSRLSILFSCTKNDSALASATRFLLVFTRGLTEGAELVDFMIDHFTEPLVRLFSVVGASIMEDISASLSNLCVVHPDHLFVRILPTLLQLLENQSNGQVRLSSCTLLKELVEVSGTAASHFVRFLLPVVMKLMTDRDETCSKTANALFADLVRVAPLTQGNPNISLKLSGTYSKCENVVDHLIFGQPLPPCEIPNAISEELKKGGIKLREYQMEGVSFLRFLHSVRLNGAICDSMGLGKTLQALVAVAISHISLQNCRPDDLNYPSKPISLVVCPASVVGHWKCEVKKYFPGDAVFRSLCYIGSATARKALRSDILSRHNIIVTSYSVLRSDIEFLAAFEWTCCILDEGHLLKNPQTATARASKRLKSTHRIILTGTPVQNKVSEIWAMFDFLLPNFLGTWKSFSKEYARPIMRSQQPGASAALVQEGMTKLKLLHQQVLPFILRREKEQVLTELPPKNMTVVRVPLSDLQQSVYHDFCTKTETKKTLETLGNGLSDALMSGDSVNAEVLKSILFLRLLCTHPSLIIPKTKERGTQAESWFSLNSSGKLVALKQLLAEAGIFDDSITAADNDESLLYCDDDTRSSDAYSDVAFFQNDSILGPNIEDSSMKSKCLIFSQFSASLDIVEELLFRQRMPSLRYLRLDGRVPSEKRAEVAEAFNKDPSISVMLLTTRVGGLGLNLTGMSTLTFCVPLT